MALKAENTYSLALYRKSLPAPDTEHYRELMVFSILGYRSKRHFKSCYNEAVFVKASSE